MLLPFVDSLVGLAAHLARPRDPHAAVGPGAGGDGAEPRRRGAAVVGELAVARRVATARSRSRRSSSRCSPASPPCSATSASSRRSRSTRRRSRSSFDAMTFLVSAVIVYRLPIPRREQRAGDRRIDWTETFREIKEGLQFVGAARAGARRDARPRVRPHRRGRDDPARSELRQGGARTAAPRRSAC